MLTKLSVRDFAIISELTLEFSSGLNVFTGETGAGKSILTSALGFLMGSRGSSSWLRAGAESLEVSGWFGREDFSQELRDRFKLAGSPVQVRRELDASGRTRAFVNGRPAPTSALAAFGDGLVDFHGQHDHQALLKPAVQLECLDLFAGLAGALAETALAYDSLSAARARIESSRMPEEERRRRLELGRWQLSEIAGAKLTPGEDEELERVLPMAKNAGRVRVLAADAYDALYERDGSVIAGLAQAERSLAELARLDPALEELARGLGSAGVAVEQASRRLGELRDAGDCGQERLDAILGRQDELARLKKKYGGATVADVLAFRDRLAAEVDLLENSGQKTQELEKELARAEERLAGLGARLHRGRGKAARKLEAALGKELRDLGMPQAALSVSVELEEGRWTRSGSDLVEFQLAPNPGEPMKSVRSIASGGELSRVMLALKTALAEADRVPILVFDEIDAGIGGAVADAVGRKVAGLGETRQIFCVTHLAQVACRAQSHFHVSKESSGGRTKVLARKLEGPERLDVLATILGGRQATAASRKHAQELLESALA